MTSSVNGNIRGNDVSIIHGDITKLEEKFDAFLVPQFPDGLADGGVTKAISHAGAQLGMDEYDAHIKTQGPLNFGDACLTASGGGGSSTLIHVVSLGVDSKEEKDECTNVRLCILNALRLAKKEAVGSIATPVLGWGHHNIISPEQAAKAMMGGVAAYARENDKNIPITFVVCNKGTYDVFVNVLQSSSYESIVAPNDGRSWFRRKVQSAAATLGFKL